MTTLEEHLKKKFDTIAGFDKEIDVYELKELLSRMAVGADGYLNVSLGTSYSIINVVDKDENGKINFEEFKELYQKLRVWRMNFERYDRDDNDAIERRELTDALRACGHTISGMSKAYQIIKTRFSRPGAEGRVTFNGFLACVSRLDALKALFKDKDTVTFSFSEIVEATIKL